MSLGEHGLAKNEIIDQFNRVSKAFKSLDENQCEEAKEINKKHRNVLLSVIHQESMQKWDCYMPAILEQSKYFMGSRDYRNNFQLLSNPSSKVMASFLKSYKGSDPGKSANRPGIGLDTTSHPKSAFAADKVDPFLVAVTPSLCTDEWQESRSTRNDDHLAKLREKYGPQTSLIQVQVNPKTNEVTLEKAQSESYKFTCGSEALESSASYFKNHADQLKCSSGSLDYSPLPMREMVLQGKQDRASKGMKEHSMFYDYTLERPIFICGQRNSVGNDPGSKSKTTEEALKLFDLSEESNSNFKDMLVLCLVLQEMRGKEKAKNDPCSSTEDSIGLKKLGTIGSLFAKFFKLAAVVKTDDRDQIVIPYRQFYRNIELLIEKTELKCLNNCPNVHSKEYKHKARNQDSLIFTQEDLVNHYETSLCGNFICICCRSWLTSSNEFLTHIVNDHLSKKEGDVRAMLEKLKNVSLNGFHEILLKGLSSIRDSQTGIPISTPRIITDDQVTDLVDSSS